MVFALCRRFGMLIGVGVRRDVRVDEHRLMRMVRFDINVGRLMHVGVRGRDESEQ